MSSDSTDDTYPESGSGDQIQFPCNICSKIFTNRLSKNRHVLYCRSKQLQPLGSRRKSCMHCRSAKTKCNEAKPQCLRCRSKKVECVYENVALDASGSQLRIVERTEPLVNSNTSEASIEEGLSSTHASIQSNDYNFPEPESYDTLLNPGHAQHSAVGPPFNSVIPLDDYTVGPSEVHEPDLPQGYSHVEPIDTPQSLLSAPIELISATPHGKTVFRRRHRSFGSQLSSYYLLQTFQSYPKMMLLDTVPPFIHHQFAVSHQNHSHFTFMNMQPGFNEPLTMCKNIMHMYFSKTKESTPFVLRAIEIEVIRLESEYYIFDVWTLMAALQALVIYILVAIIEEDGFSPKLLHVMSAISLKLQNSNYAPSITQGGEWQKWVLHESINRTFALLFIVNRLFDINPYHGPQACNGISFIPVPAHKSLWQASSHAEWTKAHTEYLLKKKDTRSLTYGDIVNFHQNSQLNQRHELPDLSEWLLNLDDFGNFVLMTAASI